MPIGCPLDDVRTADVVSLVESSSEGVPLTAGLQLYPQAGCNPGA
jgi:hypothetical protein